MKKAILLSVFVFLFGSINIMASDRIAMTELYTVYGNLAEVNHVMEQGMIDGTVLPFLISPDNPIDQKAAVINALLVNNQLKNNAETFRMFIARKYRDNWQSLDLDKLTGDELFCLGYMTLMDEDGAIENAMPILEIAKEKDPASSTIALIHAIMGAQASADAGAQCDGWNAFNRVIADSSLNNDMNQRMVSQLTDSMKSFGEGCE